ncbi:MAG TPA: hypothetical protein IAB98_03925 [Candidatus Egerieimonas intestinavium]|uniref:Gingipain domain-containing protein n=1 Tax=Candidatus Egerieimonas intestinavium TaxID=2840777 RepID=A0A9D1EJ29_9FIRM|nr:hypothetical protein [Candidatus Egerieimonas intestinavium]
MKIILICNQSLVEKKYGGTSYIFWLQVNRLLDFFQWKSFKASLALLDVKADMAKYHLPPVSDGMDQRQVKDAVDGIYAAEKPDCMALMGAQDILPFQMLKDTTPKSEQQFVASDLPYASDHAYSVDISAFVLPSRAVTRIPDLYGATSVEGMDIFIRTVDACLLDKPQPISAYTDVFCLYAKDWEWDTNQALAKLSPGAAVHKYDSPPHESPWDKKLLHQPIHYINLHGGPLENDFYGQRGNDFPVALNSENLEGSLDAGTIAIALCCFGGQLYYCSGKLPFANAYLANGASLLASTAIAYTGEAEEYSAIFMNHVRGSKMSMPSALLQTRLDYIASKQPVLDYYEQKTAAEFVLYGGAMGAYIQAAEEGTGRKAMKKQIEYIRESVGVARYNPDLQTPEIVRRRIQGDAQKGGYEVQPGVAGFDVVSADPAGNSAGFAEIKQYSVDMTDSLGRRHVFVYTVTEGEISDVQVYREK